MLNKKNLKQKFFGPKRVSLSPAQSDTSCCPDFMRLYWAHYMLSSMILAMVTGGQLIDLDGLSMTRAGKLVDAGFLQGNDVTLCCCCRFGWFEHLIILFNGAERFLMRRAGKLKASWWPGSFFNSLGYSAPGQWQPQRRLRIFHSRMSHSCDARMFAWIYPNAHSTTINFRVCRFERIDDMQNKTTTWRLMRKSRKFFFCTICNSA